MGLRVGQWPIGQDQGRKPHTAQAATALDIETILTIYKLFMSIFRVLCALQESGELKDKRLTVNTHTQAKL